MDNRSKRSLTERLIKGKRMKPARVALDSFKSYQKTMGIVEKVNIVLGKKSVYNTTVDSTLNIRVVSNGIASTSAV